MAMPWLTFIAAIASRIVRVKGRTIFVVGDIVAGGEMKLFHASFLAGLKIKAPGP